MFLYVSLVSWSVFIFIFCYSRCEEEEWRWCAVKLHSANPTEYFIIWCSQPWKCYLPPTLQHSNPPPNRTFLVKPCRVASNSQILAEQSVADIRVDFVGKLNKGFDPFFSKSISGCKFDIIGVRWEGRGAGCRLETFHYHASQIKTDSFDKSVKTRWFCTGGEREWARVGLNTGETRDTKSNGKPMYQGDWGRLRETVLQKI